MIELVPGKVQVSIIKEGEGAEVLPDSTPLINYSGRYLDEASTQFVQDPDSPVPVKLDQAMAGLSKGLIGAKEGEQRRIYIHPDYGYGAYDPFHPNSLLIFDINVVQSDMKNNSSTSDIESP